MSCWSAIVPRLASPWLCAIALALVANADRLFAADALSHAIVPGFERFYSDAASDSVRAGILLLSELNCTSCHATTKELTPIAHKQAPVLDDLFSRVRVDYVRKLLADPQRCKPGITMPQVLHAVSDEKRKEQIEALIHFLAPTGLLVEAAPVTAAAKRGERLFHSVGCVACHDPRIEKTTALATSVPLVDLSSKYSVVSLAKFLENPLAVRPSGRMPHLNLSREEAREIACFLLRDLQVPTSLTFQYYEGNWDNLPDFSQLNALETGGAVGFDVDVGRPDHFGVRFEGQFRIEREGEYRIYLGSDDGSRLLVDDQFVIDNNGIHGVDYESKPSRLTAGVHAVVVEYFEQAGGQELYVDIEGPGLKRQPLDGLLTTKDPQSAKPTLQVDLQLASRGKEIFAASGCADCHELKLGGSRLATARVSKKFDELPTTGGCLAESPPAAAPRFALTARQRESLSRAIQAIHAGAEPSAKPADRISETLTILNCYACHQRGDVGGVEDARNEFFRTNQPEMGDEGRIPPHLLNVGGKLKQDWLRHIFQDGAKDRPYMYARMPRFGENNVGKLVADFAAADGASTTAEPPISLDRKPKNFGRQLVGDKGLSCIKCHTWGNSKAQGIQAISLTTMTQRLRRDWFDSYMLDPQQFRPGTRMPAAWPNGKSFFADILEGNSAKQIGAIWSYLEDSASANPPIGLISNPIELVPGKSPVIYRNFLEGAGTRAIGVGYPEHVNIAYDAENCRLALIWQGAFMDASMHWVGRGDGFQRPLGDNVVKLPDLVPLGDLSSLSAPWPTQSAHESKFQFRGYRLDPAGRPTFLLDWKDSRIEDILEPQVTKGALSLKRTLRFVSQPKSNGWVRLAVAKSIQSESGNTFVMDGDWRIRIHHSGGQVVTRESNSRQELLVPILLATAERDSATLVVEYLW